MADVGGAGGVGVASGMSAVWLGDWVEGFGQREEGRERGGDRGRHTCSLEGWFVEGGFCRP